MYSVFIGYLKGLSREMEGAIKVVSNERSHYINPITSEAKKNYFVKGPVHNLHLKYSALYQNISFEATWFIPNCSVFTVSVIWIM